MIKSYCLLAVMFATMGGHALRGQSEKEYECFYTIGKQCPDFTFENVVNYPRKKVSIKDFRNKWLIIDFWHKGCSACIKSFPKINREQALYGDNIQFLLVGLQDDTRSINIMFDRLKEKMHLTIPCAFDSVLISRVVELKHGMPFSVIIDPDGIVRGSIPIVDEDVFKQLTLTARPTLRDYYRELFYKNKFDAKRPFLVHGNGGDDSSFIFRSLLSKCDQTSPAHGFTDSINSVPGSFAALYKTILELYMYAYTGIKLKSLPDPTSCLYSTVWRQPVLEITDSARNKEIMRNEKYSYSLNCPPENGTSKFMAKIMKQDLFNYFGYYAKLEVREMPCWKLVVRTKALKGLKTKAPGGGIKESSLMKKGENWWQVWEVTNIDIASLLNGLAFASNIDVIEGPIIDETGINFNIDLNMHFIPFDFTSIKEALQKNGLDLIKGTRAIKVLVIKD